jgi:hypothetical protein
MGIPAQIREIKQFNPLISLSIGGEVMYYFERHWGLSAGIHFENKSMATTARVKEYSMRFGDFDGLFTGYVKTNVKNGYVSVPLVLCYALPHSLLARAGIYYAYLLTPSFYGSVYDGHLRQGKEGSQTNTTISAESPSHYAFSDQLRRHDMGISCGMEWGITRHFLLSMDINFGLLPIFPSSFQGVKMNMYNVYAAFAFGYLF